MSVDETIAKEALCLAQPVAVEAAILASEEETRKRGDVLDAWRGVLGELLFLQPQDL